MLGAGMVGISCALELQQRGYPVTLIDRRAPGEEASSGNAGIFSYSNITPIASPELLPRLHRLLLNRDADFLLHYPHFLSLLPWMLRFLRRCNRKTYLADGNAMNTITQASIEIHKQWIAEIGAQHLYNPAGGLKLYRSQKTFQRDQLERELLDQCGVGYSVLDADQIQQCEPDLMPVFVRGVMIEQSLSIRDPHQLCELYAQKFIEAGGKFRQSEIKFLQQSNRGWELSTDQGVETVPEVVICMGAWTPDIIGPLGYANPLAIERGYHTILSAAGKSQLTRPIFDVDASYVMAPMEMGLRVSTGTNLVYRETAPDPRQVERVMPRVREAFPVDQVLLEQPWMGRRPTVPDTLPIIGRAPRHEKLWLAFAHSHMGFTLGPISGHLIANFISGVEQPFSTTACDPSRYL